MKPPKKIFTEKTKTSKVNAWRDNGWYEWHSHQMFVNVKGSKCPVKTPGFSWSFTGYKSDLTAPGILAHEMGHHIHCLLDEVIPHNELKSMIRNTFKIESCVSGYEPNFYESFAEAMRLFILNPDLLSDGRPARFRFFTEVLELKTLHSVPWKTVLQNAHPKMITATESWIKK
jgi:hypothetical protein